MRIACGYNPAFLNRLDIHNSVEMIEHGYEKSLLEVNFGHLKRSIHINRSPITETQINQSIWFDKFRKVNFSNSISMGFHLIGERHSNIGQYGLSSHYIPSIHAESNAINFIKQLKDMFNVDIWIENANFYSNNRLSIINSIESLNYISVSSNSGIILDISHLIINSHNVKVDYKELLSHIMWRNVIEIHLSGIYIDEHGIYHDCHSKPVHPQVWDAFNFILMNYPINENLYVNIEHSDLFWVNNSASYYHDFEKLLHILNNVKKSKINNDISNTSHNYAIHYIKSMMRKTTLDLRLFDNWIQHIMDKEEHLIIYPPEVEFFDGNLFYDSYRQFLANRY